MSTLLRPDEALYQAGSAPPILPPCEHYAGNEKLIAKALERQRALGPVFDVTCDLDDGAPRGRELEHVRMVADAVCSADNAFGRVGVRVHDAESPFLAQDLEVLCERAKDRLAYVTLPKVESVAQVERVRSLLAHLSPARHIPLHVLIEGPVGLHAAWDIAREPQVEAMALGLIDFVASHGGALPRAAAESPLQFTHQLVIRAKAELCAAALAFGRTAVHGVTVEMKNVERTREDARRARHEFGFMRQISVHPAQIEPIVEAMAPDRDELDEAVAILLAAQEQAWGPLSWKGRFEDRATYRTHWAVVRRARAAGTELPLEAQARLFASDFAPNAR